LIDPRDSKILPVGLLDIGRNWLFGAYMQWATEASKTAKALGCLGDIREVTINQNKGQ
jgi:hypothetical protein